MKGRRFTKIDTRALSSRMFSSMKTILVLQTIIRGQSFEELYQYFVCNAVRGALTILFLPYHFAPY